MKPSIHCINLIKQFEGFSAKPYLCPARIPTIGYGSTRDEKGNPVKLSDPPISEARALEIMEATLAKEYAPAVERYVQVPLTQNQFDALVDFAYNCGGQNLRGSTLLKKLNAKDYAGAAKEFDKWVNGGGKKLPGLIKRRAAERALFESKS
ncbi:lysozyme [Neisseriaceae bacterium TC5R-5]|nr:lysozyme [Neisseriaceae bacterium TC5R-5]